MEGVRAVLADNTFSLPSGPVSCARKIAESISMWIPDHLEGATTFEKSSQHLSQPACKFDIPHRK